LHYQNHQMSLHVLGVWVKRRSHSDVLQQNLCYETSLFLEHRVSLPSCSLPAITKHKMTSLSHKHRAQDTTCMVITNHLNNTLLSMKCLKRMAPDIIPHNMVTGEPREIVLVLRD
jgi:hypothetical protein